MNKNRKSGYLQVLENECIFPFGFIFLLSMDL